MGRTVENAEYIAFLRRLVRKLGARIGNGDVEDFADMVALQQHLSALMPAAAAKLRATGVTWEEIGAAVGITRQAAQQRWGNAIDSQGGTRKQ